MPKGTYKVGDEIATVAEEPSARGLIKLEAKKYTLTVLIKDTVDVYFKITEAK